MTTEHHAVLDPCRRLERDGIEVTYVAPRPDGLCDVADIERALLPHTRFVSVMAANNEIGVLQPVARIAELTRPRGIVLHTDAAQAVGKVPVDVGSSASTCCRPRRTSSTARRVSASCTCGGAGRGWRSSRCWTAEATSRASAPAP